MLSPLQIKRVLKHCERVDEDYEKMNMSGDEGLLYFDFMKNRGWCEALRLVLETNTFINDKEINEET